MKWLNELGEYYSHNRDIPQARLDHLLRCFGGEDEAVMAAAVAAYIDDHEHFPQVAGLRPYVEMAREGGRGRWPVNQTPTPLLLRERQALLERAHFGQADAAEFHALAARLRDQGRTAAAAHLERRARELCPAAEAV